MLYIKSTIVTDQLAMKEQEVYRSMRDIVNGIDLEDNLTILYAPQSGVLSRLFNKSRSQIGKRMFHALKNGLGMPINSVSKAVPMIASNYK